MTIAEYAPEWLASLQVADSTKAMYRSLVTHQLYMPGRRRTGKREAMEKLGRAVG